MTPRRKGFCTTESQRKHYEFWEYPMETGEDESNQKEKWGGSLSGKGWGGGYEPQVTHNSKTCSSLLLLTFPHPDDRYHDHEETWSLCGALKRTYFCHLFLSACRIFAVVRNQMWLQLSPADPAWQEFLEQPIYFRGDREITHRQTDTDT